MITLKELKSLKNILEKDTNISQISEENILKLINLFDIKAVRFRYEHKLSDPLDIALKFYKSFNRKFYDIIAQGILQDRVLIGPFCKKSYVNAKTKLCFIKPVGTDEDVYIMVHEMAHYVNVMLDDAFVDRSNVIYTEVFSYYIERLFDRYLIENGYLDLAIIRHQNRIESTCNIARNLKDFLELKKLYEKNVLGLLKEQEKIQRILRCKKDYPAQFYLRYLVGNLYSKTLVEEESEEPFLERIRKLDIDEEISKFRTQNLTLVLK